MFKVICINNKGWVDATPTRKHWWNKKKRQERGGPKKDDIVTVTKDVYDDGQRFYYLLEWPGNRKYLAMCFKLLEEKFDKVQYSEIIEKVEVSQN